MINILLLGLITYLNLDLSSFIIIFDYSIFFILSVMSIIIWLTHESLKIKIYYSFKLWDSKHIYKTYKKILKIILYVSY